MAMCVSSIDIDPTDGYDDLEVILMVVRNPRDTNVADDMYVFDSWVARMPGY